MIAAWVLHGGRSVEGYAVLFLAGFTLLIGQANKPLLLPKTLVIFGLAFLSWVSLTLIVHPIFDLSVLAASRYLWTLLLFLLFCGLNEQEKRSAGKAIALVAIMESGTILAQNVLGNANAGWLLNPLHDAVFLPIGFAYLFAWHSDEQIFPKARNALKAGLFIITGGLFLTFSKSGIASWALILFFLSKPTKKRTMFAGLGLVALALILFSDNIVRLKLHLDSTGFHMTSGRISIWASAVRALVEHPLIGFGPAQFETGYRLFQQPTNHILRYAMTTEFAHNNWLQLSVESGIPAVIFMGGLLWSLRVRLPWKDLDPWQKAACASMGTFLLVGFFNYSLRLPIQHVLLAYAASILIPVSRAAEGPMIRITKRNPFFLSVFLIFAIFLSLAGISQIKEKRGDFKAARSWMPLRANTWYAEGIAMLRSENNQATRALEAISRAIRLNPTDPFFYVRRAQVRALQKDSTALIRLDFEKAVALAPTHAPFWVHWGLYEFSQNRFAESVVLFERAAELEPFAPRPMLLKGIALAKSGKNQEAKVCLDKAKDLKEAEADALSHWANAEILRSEYGKYLFSVTP